MTVRNLTRRATRTTLTALGVAVGVVAIVALSSIVRGLWSSTQGLIELDGAELMVFQRGVAADIFSVLDEEADQQRLLEDPAVERAVGTLVHVMPISDQPFCICIGLKQGAIGSGEELLTAGRYPQAPDEVLVGSLAKKMFGVEPGGTLEVLGQTFKVVGVFETGVVFINGGVVFPLGALQQLAAKPGLVTAFRVHLAEDADREAVARRIEEKNPDMVAVADASEYSKADRGLEIARDVVGVVSFIALVVGSIIVANTMWMAVLERTREIGVLRAVGWSRMKIVGMVLLEAAGVGLLACVIGCAGGFGLAWLSTVLPYSEQMIRPVYDHVPMLLALVVALLLSVVGALAPAWRAAHISPAEALQYE